MARRRVCHLRPLVAILLQRPHPPRKILIGEGGNQGVLDRFGSKVLSGFPALPLGLGTSAVPQVVLDNVAVGARVRALNLEWPSPPAPRDHRSDDEIADIQVRC